MAAFPLLVVDTDPEWWLVDTPTAARLAGVAPSTIRVWAHRGRLTRGGTPRRALWDMREILSVMPRAAADRLTRDAV